jgi:hypothetical protein
VRAAYQGGIPGDVPFAGRRRELQEVGRLLERAAGGAGGLLVITGAPGAGKTALAEAAVAEASRRDFEVLRAAPAEHQPGRLVWAQLLRDVRAPEDLVTRLSATGAGPLDLDAAARRLAPPAPPAPAVPPGPPSPPGPLTSQSSRQPRLIVVDDMDRGGPDAAAMLSVVAARCTASATAMIVTTTAPLGLRGELRLTGLSQEDLAEAIQIPDQETAQALWVASRGLPGVALPLTRELTGAKDPVVYLALRAASTAAFLDLDTSLIRLLEMATERARDDATRSRILARLARELLGDASAGERRRALADEALRLARRADDPGPLAVALDARLYALWDPDGAEDRLAAGSEIIDLARAAGDDQRERQGQFWRFVALMELGRVTEAESALASYAREAAAAGDAEAAVMVTARHAMLAALRGRLDEATRLTQEVAEASRIAGMADAEAITGTLGGLVLAERGTVAEAEAAVTFLLGAAVRQPGHLYEATAARIMAEIGRLAEAAAELDRLLPRALAASGPRWVGVLADLAQVAARTGQAGAARRLARR